MSMLINNHYYYNDEYMYFMFNGIHSSKYNLFIQNDIEDLKMNINNNSSVEFASPKNQSGQYVLGVTHPQRTFSLKLAAEGLTREQIRTMVKWLKVGSLGALTFDFAPDWCFDVVIKSNKEPNLYEESANTFIVSFEVEFVTTVSPYARNVQNGIFVSNGSGNEAYNNSLLIPSIIKAEDGTEEDFNFSIYRILHLGDASSFVNVKVSYPSTVTIEGETQNVEGLSTFNIIINQMNNLNNIIDLVHFSNQGVSIKGIITEVGNDYVFEYRGKNNLFFVNNYLPEQAKSMNIINSNGFQVIYSTNSLELHSPGAPVKIQSKEHLQELANTGYNYLLCKPATLTESTTYAEGGTNTSIYPWDIKEGAVIKYREELSEEDDIKDYYFVFYTDIKIKEKNTYSNKTISAATFYTEETTNDALVMAEVESENTGTANLTIEVCQYTEVI